ncbi:GntR family transcriptional regulator [Microbacterium soli]|uniref:GntR family transcriptional regulator n=1 Tax=Microbacterium soli TaxID=446075 RepID=A0ABP7N9J2_9MICO
MATERRGAREWDSTIERRGLRDRVYERILQLLLSGEVEPGARLSIDTIARQLDVSPTPVREAMVHLERTGLVTREALKGYRMAPPLGAAQLRELFDARLMLEVEAVRLAAAAGDDMLTELREAEEHHRSAGERVIEAFHAGRNDVDLATAYYAADAAFHEVLFRYCGNRYLRQMSESLGAQLHRMRQIMRHGATDVREAIAEHEAICDAFASEDPDAPARMMRLHIEHVRARSLDLARD